MKKTITILLLMTIFATGVVVAFFNGYYATNSLQQAIEESLSTLPDNLRHRFEAFDIALATEEKAIAKKIEAELPLLTNELLALNGNPDEIPEDKLREVADRYGFTEFYLIDKDGVVCCTTFTQDKGFNLKLIGADFAAHLKSMYGKGKVFTDRLTLSSITGILNVYGYYSPPGSDWIFEVSMNIRDYIGRKRGQVYSDYLFKHFFLDAVKGDVSVMDLDLYMLNDLAAWSVAHEGKKLDEALRRKIAENTEYRIREGDQLIIYSEFDPPARTGFFSQSFRTKVTMDISRLRNIPGGITMTTIISLLFILPIAFLVSVRAMNRAIICPVEDLLKGLEAMRDGNYNKPLAPSGVPEIQRITSVANKMREEVVKREQELKASRDQLEQRVIERTRELDEARKAAEMLARTDMLTGINNRRAFYDMGQTLLRQAKRFDHPMSVIMMDIDHFKAINDTHGHAVGDQAIKRVAEIISHTARESDIIGRLGGEEFAMLLPETSADDAIPFAERLKAQIENSRIYAGEAEIAFTASFGVAEFGSKEEDLDLMMVRADKALYQAKESGRNRIEKMTN